MIFARRARSAPFVDSHNCGFVCPPAWLAGWLAGRPVREKAHDKFGPTLARREPENNAEVSRLAPATRNRSGRLGGRATIAPGEKRVHFGRVAAAENLLPHSRAGPVGSRAFASKWLRVASQVVSARAGTPSVMQTSRLGRVKRRGSFARPPWPSWPSNSGRSASRSRCRPAPPGQVERAEILARTLRNVCADAAASVCTQSARSRR